MRSTGVSYIEIAGMKVPICESITAKAIERRKVDLPPMFGPLNKIGFDKSTSFGMKLLAFISAYPFSILSK